VRNQKRANNVGFSSVTEAAARTIALITLGLSAASPSAACSCVGPIPVCSVYWSTSVLFLGHVIRVEHVYDEPPGETIGPGQYLAHFAVTKSYRGTLGEQVVVHTADQGSACGLGFQEGHDYLIYGYTASNGDLSTNHCTRTHEVADQAEDPDIRWIEALTKAPRGASVYGRIRSLRLNRDGAYDESALPGISVSIAGPQSKTVSSDAEGNFRADGLAPGAYVVSAEAPQNYVPFPKSTVTLQEHSCAEIPWSTKFDGHIRGHVYFHDGSPAAGVYLTAKIADSNPHEPWAWQAAHTTAGSDGTFDFATMAPGTYIFAVNLDFSPLPGNGDSYYRKAFYPGAIHRSEAALVAVGPGEKVDRLSFFLPPDSAKPSVPLQVTILDFAGKPVPHADVVAYDGIWGLSVTPLMATADESGKANVTLRPDSHYDIEAVVNLSDSSQACAEPVGVNTHDSPAPVILMLSHHVGNCMQFKMPPDDSR
jgi:protocatechuate 3,4-dioxygenase beta subunit